MRAITTKRNLDRIGDLLKRTHLGLGARANTNHPEEKGVLSLRVIDGDGRGVPAKKKGRPFVIEKREPSVPRPAARRRKEGEKDSMA